jgi:hypothetical protein
MWGSDLWNEAIQNGNISDDDGYSIIADSKRNLGNFSGKELTEFCEKATQKFFFRPWYIVRQVLKAIRTQSFRFLRTQLNHL